MLVRAFQFPGQPVVAHLVPVRRCNLSCTYCNEYDAYSAPVPTSDVIRRDDLLAALGVGIVTMSGGEPLLHPELDEIVRRVRPAAWSPRSSPMATCSVAIASGA